MFEFGELAGGAAIGNSIALLAIAVRYIQYRGVRLL